MHIPVTYLYTALLCASWLVFVISLLIDRRRFRNGVYFLGALVMTAIFLVHTYHSPAVYIPLAMIIEFFVLVVPFLLILNGFTMIRKEGFRIPNLLSMLFGILIFAGEIFLIAAVFHASFLERWQLFLLFACGYSVFYISMVFLAFMFYSLLISVLPRRIDYDYVIVLGAGLAGGERVTKLLADRLDKAVQVYENSMSLCRIIVSGGKGSDEKISEAQAMKNYLLENGIKENDILLEDQSSDTMENLQNSKEIIYSRKGRKLTALVTSSYHVFRAMLYSKKLSFPLTGIGSRIAFYYWPSAMIREYAALVVRYIIPYVLTGAASGSAVWFLLTH